ncbi:MAG: hypothetical protein KC729_19595 [Candidatus Eisenbacteria bacterium]|uniref:Uncharacterized protein n=1 Tax=Eiseniibacteriota bacterium TaxID=2212470 RepID=A0A956RRT3_UNCEI|nr:hypothetical protein [Candidatus Eisenbacteria bacterium]
MTGNRRLVRRLERRIQTDFPEATADELRAAEERTPPELRWWAATPRPANEEESRAHCLQCRHPLGAAPVKECPGCRLVLHAACYDAPWESYAAPGCECCRLRTYSR